MSAVVRLVEKAVDTVVNTVENIIENPLPTIVSLAGQAIGIPAPVTMAAMTAAQGGDLEDIAKAAVISVAAPAATSVVASALSPAVSSVITNEVAANAVTTATSQALVNGSIAAASGGNFSDAATGSFAGSLAASGYQQYLAPTVAEQAQSLGLEKSTTAGIQQTLSSALSSGTAAAATGNDFATGFNNALAETGMEVTTSALFEKANQGIKSLTKTAASDYGVDVNPPTDAGIPQTLVAEVPMSLEGQLAQISEMEKPEEYGQQYGPALAASQYTGIPGYEPAQISGYETISDNVPEDVAGVLEPIEVTEKPLTDDDLKRAAITGDTDLLAGLTQMGEISPMGEPAVEEVGSPAFDFNKYLREINQKSSASSSSAIDAQVRAMLNPTPENIAAAQEAQMAAELDQKSLSAALMGDVPENVPYDPSTDLAAFGGSEPSYGGSLPGQEGIGGIGVIGGTGGLGGAGQSGAGQGGTGIAKTGLNAIQAAIAAAASSGGKNFIAPSSPLYETTTAYQRKAAPAIDMQSNIYMSPQDYAARSQLSNLFKVARGGLITLKNLR